MDFGGADLAMNLLSQGMTGQRPVIIKNNYPDPEKASFINMGDYSVVKGKVVTRTDENNDGSWERWIASEFIDRRPIQ